MKLAIVGRAGHGKDTIGEAVIALGAQRVAFADPIKEMACTGLGISREVLWGPAEVKEQVVERYGVTTRHILQTLGTEWGRNCVDQDIWVKRAIDHTIPQWESAGVLDFVVTDVRFLNEAELLREAGFVIVRVERPGYGPSPTTWWERCLHAATFGLLGRVEHQSESELARIEEDVKILNDGTVDDLKRKARALANRARREHWPEGR